MPTDDMETLSDEEILSQYAYTPNRMITGMVCPLNTPVRPTNRPWRQSSSIGRLGKLPIEVPQMTLEQVDFQSLSRLSRASTRGGEVVASLPAYQDMTKHAFHTLIAMGEMGILGMHSAAKLQSSLQSAECVACGRFGAFLFFMTAERCCWRCLSLNPSLWVMPRPEAGKCFDLSQRQLKQLSTARSIPGTYFVRFERSRRRVLHLVAVREALTLALAVHRHPLRLDAHLAECSSSKSYHYWSYLHRAGLQLSMQGITDVLKDGPCSNDYSNGMASGLFPELTRTGADAQNGRWCRDCQWLNRNDPSLSDEIIRQVIPEDVDPGDWLWEMGFLERSKVGFLEHARSCYGVKMMSQMSAKGLEVYTSDRF